MTSCQLRRRIAAQDATTCASSAAAALSTEGPEGVAGNDAAAEPVGAVPPLAMPRNAIPQQCAKQQTKFGTAMAVATNVVAIGAAQEFPEAPVAAMKPDVYAVV